jgi:predicted RNA binding protein YcfA (HicA-like mRNA interferase family)
VVNDIPDKLKVLVSTISAALALAYAGWVPLKVRDLIKVLEQNGWRYMRTNGDHRIFRGPAGKITVVSGRLGEDVKAGTYRAS